ncbi:MAG: hypothetical protein NC299_16085 [Lachnospiraceae bacterium]|nr:hypothetical protein [Lachnospiraceae bacterium]
MTFPLSACNNVEKESSSDTESSSTSSSTTDSVSPEDEAVALVMANHPDAEILEVVEGEDGAISVTYRVSGQTGVFTKTDGAVQWSMLSSFWDNFPSYEEVQAKYPDKTVLVWTIEETLYERHSPFHVDKVNEYLDEQGCDFAVCFYPLRFDYDIDTMYPDKALTMIKELLDGGERIDIISAMNYDEFVFDGMLEQLDGYLETDVGRVLYGAFPEKLWETLRINGGIYGVSGYMSRIPCPDPGYYVNAELAEKYNYDVTKPVLEQLDILKAVKENEKKIDVFSSYSDFDSIIYFMNAKMLSRTVYWNSETHSAELSIDNPVYIEGLRMYDTLKREGVLKLTDTSHSENFFIRADQISGGGVVYADTDTVDVDYFGNTVTAIPVFTTYSTVRTVPLATGICSKSADKEKAFELLAKIFTDPVLNNLLVYGVEGENYILENGIVKELELPPDMEGFNINAMNTIRFANQMICHRSEDNLLTPEQYVKIFENAEVFADYDFALDPKNILNELNAEYNAADNISLPEDDQTLDEVLAAYREGLYAAGVQTIIDECNRQYEVYKNEKN